MGRLENKVAIITGGAQGIGKATALRFLKEDAIVIIWDLNEEKGNQLVSEAKIQNKNIDFYKVDITAYDLVESLAKTVKEKYQHIDILINNAGITKDSSLLKMDVEKWQQVINVNLTGTFNCTKAIAPYMVEQNYGRIINTSSIVGLYGNFGQTNYVASKSGVIGMTKVWARELGRKGINVNAVAPGFIETDMITSVPEKIINSLKEKTPLGRLGKPDDIASAYLFLASDEASYINGAILSVDGGLVI